MNKNNVTIMSIVAVVSLLVGVTGSAVAQDNMTMSMDNQTMGMDNQTMGMANETGPENATLITEMEPMNTTQLPENESIQVMEEVPSGFGQP